MPGVSSLMCPATLLVTRHGDAEYVEDFLSDEGGTLTQAAMALKAAANRAQRSLFIDHRDLYRRPLMADELAGLAVDRSRTG